MPKQRWLNGSKSSYMWKQIKQHPFIVVGIIVVIFALTAFAIAVIMFGWDWTGFTGGESKVTTTMITPGTTTTTTPRATVATEQQPAKTLWDWLGLLAVLTIPAVVGLGAAWFTAQQGKESDRENKDNQRETALQAYVDKMSELLLEKNLRESAKDDEVRVIARVRTMTILPRLDATRKSSVLLFLHESGLIEKGKYIIDLSGANLSAANLRTDNLSTANLRKTYLGGANLWETDLSEAILSEAILSRATMNNSNLVEADLSEATLIEADLSGADMHRANLSRADLSGATLFGVNLSEADLSDTLLSGATLIRANLSNANLSGADLRYNVIYQMQKGGYIHAERVNLQATDLSGANLFGAEITTEQLNQAKSLKGATMPDGSIHE
jgi:uncharacterized protein YjbI with pentapeptide repeats